MMVNNKHQLFIRFNHEHVYDLELFTIRLLL